MSRQLEIADDFRTQQAVDVCRGRHLEAGPELFGDARAADWNPGQSFRRNDSYFQTSLRGDWDIVPNITLTSISTYARLLVNNPVDYDGTQYSTITLTLYQVRDGNMRTYPLAEDEF